MQITSIQEILSNGKLTFIVTSKPSNLTLKINHTVTRIFQLSQTVKVKSLYKLSDPRDTSAWINIFIRWKSRVHSW